MSDDKLKTKPLSRRWRLLGGVAAGVLAAALVYGLY